MLLRHKSNDIGRKKMELRYKLTDEFMMNNIS